MRARRQASVSRGSSSARGVTAIPASSRFTLPTARGSRAHDGVLAECCIGRAVSFLPRSDGGRRRPARAVRLGRAAPTRGDGTLVRTSSQASLILENSGGPARARDDVV